MIASGAASDADLRATLAGHKSLQLLAPSPQATQALAGRIARMLVSEKRGTSNEKLSTSVTGDLIALIGDLGSGKTTFVQGFCSALAIDQRVTSPTFTLMHIYWAGEQPVYHFDFYRLNSLEEIDLLGCQEYFDTDAISLIEWPELALPLMPVDPLIIRFTMPDFVGQPQTRVLEIARRQANHR